tara:strand:+ start:11035 stop:12198 length:1164 start_codon:yes stop_codon:yes gene_type:complete
MNNSKRSKNINAQPMFEILQAAREEEGLGRHIIHLEIGDSSPLNNIQIFNLLKKNLSNAESLQYSPSEGEKKLREAFLYHYKILCNHDFTIDNVVVTPANAAISQVINSITDAGDAMLLPDPGFPTFSLSAQYFEVKKVLYELNQKQDYQLNVEDIKDKINSNKTIKGIIINNPSNPLGIYHDLKDIDEITKFCEEKKVYVILDDTYRCLIYNPTYKRNIHRSNIIYIYSMSKDTASPAMRVGCVVGHESVIKSISRHNSLFYSCLPKFIQLAAAEYLMEDHRPYRIAMRDEMISRIESIDKIFKQTDTISYVKPNAGIYFWINVHKTGMSGKELSLKLLKESGVCVCPGDAFGPSGVNYIRICISGDRKLLVEGVNKIYNFVCKKN